jgi:hypothetical protein
MRDNDLFELWTFRVLMCAVVVLAVLAVLILIRTFLGEYS